MLTPGSTTLSRPISPALTDVGVNDAIPDCIMPEDFGDLLFGIGADELDDFGDMDEDISTRDTQEVVPAALEEQWDEGSPIPDVAVGTGFATGSGRKLPPPSTTALAKARKFWDNDEIVSAAGPSPSQEHDNLRPNKKPRIDMMSSSGFTTGKGVAVPPPSKTSTERAAKLFEDLVDVPLSTTFTAGGDIATPLPARQSSERVAELFGDLKNVEIDATPTSGFTTGKGIAVPAPSISSTERAAKLFNDLDTNTDAIPLSTGFQLGSGKIAPKPRTDSVIRARQLLGEADLPATTNTPSKPTMTMAFVTPSRPPLAVTTNTFSTPKPIQIKTPSSSVRRIGLGLGSTPSQVRTKRAFITPFKKSATPAPAPLVSSPTKSPTQPVFDLTPISGRSDAKSSSLHPQYYSPVELKELGIPNEIWLLHLDNAKDYQFVTEGAKIFGTAQAYTLLKKEHCQSATVAWVENHWSQVLWKIAGQVQAKPAMFEEKWQWTEVIRQLKYRYEREYGSAQRPLIRRIQEHDSSSGMPMILVISAIKWSTEEGQKPVPHLELTDGWYCIRAQIDECLIRAVRKERITVGRKLAIIGAKLESAGEGCEVLKAFGRSNLVISGNSTSLSRWYRKLGPQSKPFIANLSSLSADGGLISAMDIVIEKIFPLAYVSGNREAKEAPWNEEEEQVRQDKWNEQYLSEQSRLQAAMQKELEKLEDVASLLASHAEEGPIDPGDSPDSIDTDFDALLGASDASIRMRHMSTRHIFHLARYAQTRMSQEVQDKQQTIEMELKTLCPPRSARDFRMIRFHDAREGLKEPFRVGMLNAWEAKGLEGLKEGQRYLITNLYPSRSGDWSLNGRKTEIYIHTRRETRWQLIE